MTQVLEDARVQKRERERLWRPRRGSIFMPCVVCRAPVDLGAALDPALPPLCAEHEPEQAIGRR